MSSEDIDRAPVRFASVAFGEIFFRDLVLSEFHYLHSGPMGATDQAEGVQAFIAKWAASGAAERANAQLFVAE